MTCRTRPGSSLAKRTASSSAARATRNRRTERQSHRTTWQSLLFPAGFQHATHNPQLNTMPSASRAQRSRSQLPTSHAKQQACQRSSCENLRFAGFTTCVNCAPIRLFSSIARGPAARSRRTPQSAAYAGSVTMLSRSQHAGRFPSRKPAGRAATPPGA